MRPAATRRFDPASSPSGSASRARATRRRRRKWGYVRTLGMTIVSIAVGTGIGMLLRGESPQMVVQQWQQRLEAVPEEEIPQTLQQAVANDEIGIPLLAASLASSREAVVQEAQRLLDERLQELRNQPTGESAATIQRLAAALSGRIDEYSPAAKQQAQSIAHQLLLWPAGDDGDARIRLVAHCEQILRGTSAEQAGATPPASDDVPSPFTTEPVAARDSFDQLAGMDRAVDRFAALPGGGLPVAPRQVPSLPPSAASPIRVSPPDGRPRELPPSNQVQPLRPSDAPQRLPVMPPGEPVRQAAPQDSPIQRLNHTGPTAPVSATPTPAAVPPPALAPGDVAGAATLRLVHSIVVATPETVETIQRELMRRGFTPVDLVLASRFNSPYPEARLALVQEIASARTPLATQWLLWLSYDVSPAVRYEAISLLATSRDAAIMNRMIELRQHEPEGHILKLADEYLGRMRR